MKRLYNFLLPLLLLAPDGAGWGGPPPGEAPLEDWIKRLNDAEGKDQGIIVGLLANTLDIKVKDAYKKLKAAGWNPSKKGNSNNTDSPPAAGEHPGPVASRAPDDTQQGVLSAGGTPAVGGVTVTLRHRSPYPLYRRAGLVLTRQWKPCEVSEEQLAALKNDAWVELQNPSGPDKT
jgi:hypothetical protein